ncbi:hypothetical protein RDWZM_008357 [Blomia tropicalis]|uniref:non-specific serine/threonine protein kinase n=1 Tax=Blomia tropicalis TaxID=40697 RepID=A0A9Q0M0U8_BLOTA|nr:hypothetical protein RDWZM_008357 [Blomia tropicalis]
MSTRKLTDITNVSSPTVDGDQNGKKPYIFDMPQGFVDRLDCINLLRNVRHYENVERLGAGCFGAVYSVKTPNEETLACKLFNLAETKDHLVEQLEMPITEDSFNCIHRSFVDEFKILNEISHPNIIKAIECFQMYRNDETGEIIEYDNTRFNITKQQKLLLGGILLPKYDCDIKTWMKKRKIERIDMKTLIELFVQIGNAVIYLNTQLCMVHQDIATNNIMLVRDVDPTVETPKFMLIDFGIAKFYNKKLLLEAQERSKKYHWQMSCKDLDLFGDSNPFLNEGYYFGTRLIYTSKVHMDPETENDKLSKILSIMGNVKYPTSNHDRVTVEWALNQYFEH